MTFVGRFLLIIGAAKSGSSTLFSLLSRHPSIEGSAIKEPDFFSTGAPYSSVPVLDEYVKLWPNAEDSNSHKWLLEASTSYTKFPVVRGVPQKISIVNAEFKFIYVMRDPFSRIESHYNWCQADRAWRHKISDAYLSQVSDYWLQLSQYMEFFPKSSFYLLTLEQLKTDLRRSLYGIADFLDISRQPFVDIKAEHLNSTQGQSVGELALLRLDSSKLVLRLPRPVKNAGKQFLRFVTPGYSKKLLTSDQRELIFQQLYPGMIRLKDEFGVDVSSWGFAP